MPVKAGIVTLVGLLCLNMIWANKAQGAGLLRTKRDTIIPDGDFCNEKSWIDVDHGLVCGECKVLADNMVTKYRTCNAYCAGNGLQCKAAWEEQNESCTPEREEDCEHDFGRYTSDAICECIPKGGSGIHGPLIGDNSIYEIIKGTTKGIETLGSVLMKIKDSSKKTDMPIDEVLRQAAHILGKKVEQFADDEDYLSEESVQIFLGVKNKLREAKNDLIAIADKAITACEDVIIFMDGWDVSKSIDERKAYLQEQINAIKILLETTKDTLERTKTKYDDSIVQLGKFGSELNAFEQRLEDMLDDKSIAHKNWTENVRLEIYSRNENRSTGASGTLSKFVEEAVEFITHKLFTRPDEASQAQILRIEAALEGTKEATHSAVIAVNSAKYALSELQMFFGTNIQAITKWVGGANKMNEAIAVAVDDAFHQLPTLRREFQISVDRLLTKSRALLQMD